jgi:L-lysine exporter family protein LysE/ArgO
MLRGSLWLSLDSFYSFYSFYTLAVCHPRCRILDTTLFGAVIRHLIGSGICALSDAVLILIGVSGFHVLVASFPSLVKIARFGGAAFLFIYGLISFYNALRVQQGLQPSEIRSNSAWQSALTCLAFTWLNPHVYLDTVVLLGSISTQFSEQIVWFTGGAITASFLFFFALGFGARLLRPIFAQARAWRVLDFLIGCIMWAIALRLVLVS